MAKQDIYWQCAKCGHIQIDSYNQDCDKCFSDNIHVVDPRVVAWADKRIRDYKRAMVIKLKKHCILKKMYTIQEIMEIIK